MIQFGLNYRYNGSPACSMDVADNSRRVLPALVNAPAAARHCVLAVQSAKAQSSIQRD